MEKGAERSASFFCGKLMKRRGQGRTVPVNSVFSQIYLENSW